jgi:hypothetical protein
LNTDCNDWEICDSTIHMCDAQVGRCTVHNDCPSGEVCDQTTHVCR